MQKAEKMQCIPTADQQPTGEIQCIQRLPGWPPWGHLLQQKSQPFQVHSMFPEISIYSFIDPWYDLCP